MELKTKCILDCSNIGICFHVSNALFKVLPVTKVELQDYYLYFSSQFSRLLKILPVVIDI